MAADGKSTGSFESVGPATGALGDSAPRGAAHASTGSNPAINNAAHTINATAKTARRRTLFSAQPTTREPLLTCSTTAAPITPPTEASTECYVHITAITNRPKSQKFHRRRRGIACFSLPPLQTRSSSPFAWPQVCFTYSGVRRAHISASVGCAWALVKASGWIQA